MSKLEALNSKRSKLNRKFEHKKYWKHHNPSSNIYFLIICQNLLKLLSNDFFRSIKTLIETIAQLISSYKIIFIILINLHMMLLFSNFTIPSIIMSAAESNNNVDKIRYTYEIWIHTLKPPYSF